MNAHTVIAVMASTIVLGAVTADAQMPERDPVPRKRSAAKFQQQQRCPQCGFQKQRRRGPNPWQQRQRNQYGRQQRRPHSPAPGFAPHRRRGEGPPADSRYAPQHRRNQQPSQFKNRQKVQQRRQKILKRFDRDGDGRLSEQERKALKNAIRSKRSDSGDKQAQKPGDQVE